METMTVRALSDRLAAPGPKPVILDVREEWELRLCALPGTLHIPMGQIPSRIGDLDRHDEIVVVCHHGIRSAHMIRFLEGLGFTRLINLHGGLDAWAREIDPIMHKY